MIDVARVVKGPRSLRMAGKKNKKNADDAGSLITSPGSATKQTRSSSKMTDGETEELKVYLPGMELAEGEVLEVDPSAYVMLHELNAEWPCLSFDIVRDVGSDERTAFPMSGYLVTGTQADQRDKNQLLLLRCTNLHKTQELADDDSDSDSENEDEEDEDEGKKNPRHYCTAIPHDGGVNRIRTTNIMEDEAIRNVLTATWSDTGNVHIWDLQSAFGELASLGPEAPPSFTKKTLKPVYSVTKHGEEGYALAWSPLASGKLLSGDCQGHIYLTQVGTDRIETNQEAFRGHTGSVEDLHWSPSEATVFASCSTDKTVRVWDIRMPHDQPALSTIVHETDVNVMSWSKVSSHMVATGADDGSFAIWDLRMWTPTPQPTVTEAISRFNWHKDAITSIEWSPHDASVLAVSGADDQLTIWDFAINELATVESFGDRQVPPQLLFIHQGQKEIKELHWHPQLCGVLASTALSGFNIFKTISI